MSLVVSTLVAATVGIVIRNGLGYLNSGSEGFDKKKSIASAIIGFMTGVPLVGSAFLLAFPPTTTPLPEVAQLLIFFVQVGAVAGIESMTKTGLKARAKGIKN